MRRKLAKLNHYNTASRVWELVAIMLIVATVIGISVLAYTPPVSRDALDHHLALPKLYLKQGAIFELPDRVFSYYPMNLDLLYLIPLYLGNDILAKYIHFGFALMTALLIFGFLKKRIGGGFGLFGALIFLSTPVVIKLATTAYVDLGLAFFSTAALLSLLRWRAQNFKLRYLIVASIWCGLALGTKYQGLIVFFILTNLSLLLFMRSTRPGHNNLTRVLKVFLLFTGLSLLIFSPWMYRNVLWKNNPVYPLFNSFFQSALNARAEKETATADSNPIEIKRDREKTARRPIGHFEYRAIAYEESGVEIALIPLRIFFQGQDGKPKYFDGILNPLLLLLPLFAFAGIRGDPESGRTEKNVLLMFAVLFIIIIFISTDMRIRYILPAVPPLSILSAYGVRSLIGMIAGIHSKVRQRAALGFLCLLVAGFLMQNYLYLSRLFKAVQPLAYISGNIGRDAYIEQFRPAISVHRYAARHLAKDAKILGLFIGYRSYYSDRKLVFGKSIFKNAVKQSESAGQIARHLRSQGLTHLLIRYDLFDKWGNDNFTETEKTRLRHFFTEFAPRLFTGKGYGLYAIGAG